AMQLRLGTDLDHGSRRVAPYLRPRRRHGGADRRLPLGASDPRRRRGCPDRGRRDPPAQGPRGREGAGEADLEARGRSAGGSADGRALSSAAVSFYVTTPIYYVNAD